MNVLLIVLLLFVVEKNAAMQKENQLVVQNVIRTEIVKHVILNIISHQINAIYVLMQKILGPHLHCVCNRVRKEQH